MSYTEEQFLIERTVLDILHHSDDFDKRQSLLGYAPSKEIYAVLIEAVSVENEPLKILKRISSNLDYESIELDLIEDFAANVQYMITPIGKPKKLYGVYVYDESYDKNVCLGLYTSAQSANNRMCAFNNKVTEHACYITHMSYVVDFDADSDIEPSDYIRKFE